MLPSIPLMFSLIQSAMALLCYAHTLAGLDVRRTGMSEVINEQDECGLSVHLKAVATDGL